MTDCPHCVLCVHGTLSFYSISDLVSMAKTLWWYVCAKNNNKSNTDVVLQHDDMLPSRWIIIRDNNITSYGAACAALYHAAISASLKEVGRLAVYCHFTLDFLFTTTKPRFCKEVQHIFYKQHLTYFTFYMVWEREKAMTVWTSSTGPLQPKEAQGQSEFQYWQSDGCRAGLQRLYTGLSLAWGHWALVKSTC